MVEREGEGGIRARWHANSLASRVSLARACSSLRPLHPSSCYADHENSLLLPCCLVHCFFSFQSLQECIRALGRKGAHLPFRASKLTQVRNFIHSSGQLLCQGRINYLTYRNGEQRRIYMHSVSSFVVIYSLRYCFTPQVLRDSFIGENSKTCMVRFDCEWSFRDLDQSP